MDFDIINKDVKSILSEKRYNHSLGVSKKAVELAEIYNVDKEKAKIVGIVHDIAKELTDEQIKEYIQKYNINLDEIEMKNNKLPHAKIGAHICKTKYEFTQDMTNAILYHTTGNPNMDILAKIIYVADKIEENRSYDDLEYIRKLADENLDKAIIYILEKTIKKNQKKGKTIHKDSILTIEKLKNSI